MEIILSGVIYQTIAYDAAKQYRRKQQQTQKIRCAQNDQTSSYYRYDANG